MRTPLNQFCIIPPRSRVTNYRWMATGPETITGPGGATAKQWTYPTGIAWDPGDYTISLEVTFDNGLVKTTTYPQRVGIRTQDVLVVAWINPNGVQVDPTDVYPTVVAVLPPWGLGIPASPIQKAAALAYLASLAAGFDERPLGPLGNKLSATDRRYVLNWMFKYGSNSPPPAYFFNELDLGIFKTVP